MKAIRWRHALAPLIAAAVALAVPASRTASAQAPSSASASASAAAPDRADLMRIVGAAEAAVRTEPETLRRLTDQALALLVALPDPDVEARVRIWRCDYFNERDREAAQREIERLHALASTLSRPGLRAAILGCEGEFHELAGLNSRAMDLYGEAVQIAEAARDERHLAQVLFLRGWLRGVVGDFTLALGDLKRALTLYQKLEMAEEVRTTIGGVASLYSRMGAYDDARLHYEEALRSFPGGPATRERVVAQYNLGRSYVRGGRLADALRLFEQVQAQSRALKFVRGEAHALRGMASVYNARDEAARALSLADTGLRLAGQIADRPLYAQLLLQRGIALRLLHRTGESLAALREAIRVFAGGEAGPEEGEAREELARAAADAGDWREAYEQQTRSRAIVQGLLRQQVDNRFAAMKAQFDSEVRERELQVLQRENLAAERTVAAQQRSAQLQVVAVVLASALAVLLGAIAWRLHHARRQMAALAMTDELTGLPNRRQALAAVESLLAAGDPAALLILDIDHFKRINDQHGHAVGDAVLRAVAEAWRRALPPAVTLGRLGGEEFVAVIGGVGLDDGKALGEQLRQTIANLDLPALRGTPRLTTSVGVTALVSGDNVADALARADTALYRAKEAGRDRVEAQV